MRLVITIFDNEFKERAGIEDRAKMFCDTNKIVGACLYTPRPGMLMDFMKLLWTNNIHYYPGIHLTLPHT
jgi:hypothetical protein